MKVINVSSGADGGQFLHENVMSTAFIFLLGALGGIPGAYRGQFYWEKVMSFGLRIIIETLA